MAFSEYEINCIITACRISSFLGVVGSLCTIFTYAAFRDARTFGTHLVVLLSIADLGVGLGPTMGVFIDESMKGFDVICSLQGTFIQFSEISIIFWSFMIGVSIFLIFIIEVDLETFERRMFIPHIFVWGLSAIGAIIPLINNKYSRLFPNNPRSWCWIGDVDAWERLLMYGPDLTVFVLLCVIYPWVFFRLQRRPEAKAFARNMALYMLVFIVCQVPAMINRLYFTYWAPTSNPFIVTMMHFCLQPLQGFVDCIVFCWNEPIFMEQYRVTFWKLKNRCFGKRSQYDSIGDFSSKSLYYTDDDVLPPPNHSITS